MTADMTILHRQTLIVSTLLLLAALYVVFLFFPVVSNVSVIGYSGKHLDGRLLVTGVFEGSPAETAGVKEGDLILEQAGLPISAWHRMYASDMTAYIDARRSLIARPGEYKTLTGSDEKSYKIVPRRFTLTEIAAYYGVRIFLVLFVFGLTIFIVTSKTREQSAFLVCMCFCFAIIWFASDRRYWPVFSSPLIHDVDPGWLNFIDLVELISLQLVMGTLLHISLMFPERRIALDKHKWLPVLLYASAILVPLGVLLVATGDLADRIADVYKPRIFVNTVLIVMTTVLMVDSYRNSGSPAMKERTRWIVAAMAVVAIGHLILWNVPTLIAGRALISNYDWLLFTVVLLPISLTMSINHHELFGIRGIIRGRIRLLETMLARERKLVKSRDSHISRMQTEVHSLKEALNEYEIVERHEPAGLEAGLNRLQKQFPELRVIRRRLIGASPLWQKVFEQTVLAARGTGAVMIVGESGTGKTDVAWAVHRLGDRRDREYREVSCAQFEHADPAFALGRLFGVGTGHGLANVPKEGKKGLLEECDGGTLLLDDFDRLPLNVQDLLLYPLEDKPFDPGIGSGPRRRVSVKFIFATNSDPEILVEQGKFRNDVLARIAARIDIPPLRERPEDIPLLVEHLVKQLSDELGHDVSVVSPKALNLLCHYPYDRANIRALRAELRKAISKAMLEGDSVIRAGYLSEVIRMEPSDSKPALRSGSEPARTGNSLQDSTELEVLRRHRFQIISAEEELGFSHKSKTLSNHLRGMCIQAMADSNWDSNVAARSLAGEYNEKEIQKLKSKIDRFMARIEQNVRNKTGARLFNNLPAAYHQALSEAIERADGAQ